MNIDDQIDAIIDHFDMLFLEGKWEEADASIPTFLVEQMDTFLCVAILAATLPAASKLPNRATLVQRVRDRLLIIAPDRIDDLMEGLV